MGGYRGVSFFSVGSPLTQTHFVDPSGFTRFPLQGESEGRGRGTWLYNRWGRGACVARVESVMENTLCTVQMEERGAPEGGEPV